MQEDFRLIVDLVTVLAAASFGGLLAAALRLPVLLGYIFGGIVVGPTGYLLYTSPSPRDGLLSRMPSSA